MIRVIQRFVFFLRPLFRKYLNFLNIESIFTTGRIRCLLMCLKRHFWGDCRSSFSETSVQPFLQSLPRLCFLRVSVILSTGGTWAGTPPRDQVHPREQVHPPGTRYIPLGPGTPLGTGTPSRDQVHPPEAVHVGRYGQLAGGTHPTGMHSCLWK